MHKNKDLFLSQITRWDEIKAHAYLPPKCIVYSVHLLFVPLHPSTYEFQFEYDVNCTEQWTINNDIRSRSLICFSYSRTHHSWHDASIAIAKNNKQSSSVVLLYPVKRNVTIPKYFVIETIIGSVFVSYTRCFNLLCTFGLVILGEAKRICWSWRVVWCGCSSVSPLLFEVRKQIIIIIK